MQKCSNCDSEFDIRSLEGLVIYHGVAVVGAVCPECVSGVKTCKVVLKRSPLGQLAYDQYSALEMSQKAFGRNA